MNQELSTEPDSLVDTAMLARAKAWMDCTDVVEEECWCSIVVSSQHANTKWSFHHQRPRRRNTQNKIQDRKPHTKPGASLKSVMLH